MATINGSPVEDLRVWQRLTDVPLRKTLNVREGLVVNMGATVYVGPLTYWSFMHAGRWPLLSEYQPGMSELRRERRWRSRR